MLVSRFSIRWELPVLLSPYHTRYLFAALYFGGKDPISLFLLQVIHSLISAFRLTSIERFLAFSPPLIFHNDFPWESPTLSSALVLNRLLLFEVDSTGMQGCQNNFAYIFTRRYLSSKTYTLCLFILSFANAFVKPVTSFQPTSI